MLCEKCKKNEASCFYHENLNGKETSYKLCTECMESMKKSGEIKHTADFATFFDEDEFFAPMKSFGSLFGSLFAPSTSHMLNSGSVKCPGCGSSLRDISKSGMAGCPECYTTFRREFKDLVERIHGRRTHTGRAPAKIGEQKEKADRIASLEAERAQAIKSENYERAAEIRDELKKLRESL